MIKLLFVLGVAVAIVLLGGVDLKFNPSSGTGSSPQTGKIMGEFMQQIGLPDLGQHAANAKQGTAEPEHKDKKVAAVKLPAEDTDKLDSTDRNQLNTLLDEVLK